MCHVIESAFSCQAVPDLTMAATCKLVPQAKYRLIPLWNVQRFEYKIDIVYQSDHARVEQCRMSYKAYDIASVAAFPR